MLIYQEIVTERLKLRFPKREDYPFQYKYLSDKNNFLYADIKVVKTMEEVEEYYQKMLKDHLKTSLFWMICDKITDVPIGTLSAWNVDYENMTIEFGYSLYKESRHNGFMKEAIQATIEFLKQKNNFYTFDIWTDERNKSSRNLAISLNFTYLGNILEKAKYENKTITYSIYRLILERNDNEHKI